MLHFYLPYFVSSRNNKVCSDAAIDHVFCFILVFHQYPTAPDKAMPFEVHRRFWMQPNIILCVWSGIGVTYMINIAKKSAILFARFANPKNAVFVQYLVFGLYMLLSIETAYRWSEQYIFA